MSDKWRFDPNQDYTSDDDGDFGNRRGNFQRFKNRRKNKKHSSNDDDYNERKTKHPSWR